MVWYVYILECLNKSLYTGITTNLKQRLKVHKQGKGGHFTQGFGARKILYFETCANRSAASKREYEIKSWTRRKKLELIQTEK